MQIARFEPSTTVEGPGTRAAVWFQGCSLLCANCCNPQMQTKDAGKYMSCSDLLERMIGQPNDGLTLLGGEPLDQADELFSLLSDLKSCYNGNIMLFTGYTWEQIQSDNRLKNAAELCDLVIAGPFVEQQASRKRRWIGSDNQTVHFITERMSFLGPDWPKDKTEIEVLIKDGEILVNGSVIDRENELEKMFASLLKE